MSHPISQLTPSHTPVVPFIHGYSNLPNCLPTFNQRWPPNLPMPGVFTLRYPHLTPNYPRLFYTIQVTKPPESAIIGVSESSLPFSILLCIP